MKKELNEEEKIDNEILDLLMKKGIKSANDISNTLNQMYGKVVQRLLDEEFNEFMEYDTILITLFGEELFLKLRHFQKLIKTLS